MQSFPAQSDETADPVIAVYKRDIDLSLIRRNIERTPEERIVAMMEMNRLVAEMRAGLAGSKGSQAPDRP